MTGTTGSKDLVCLVADKNIEQSILALLNRHQALGIRPLTYEIHVHPEHDPGCLRYSPEFLRSFLIRADHAMVVFDREGSGRAGASREELEADVEDRLLASGWEDRAAAVTIDPELEAWVWSESPHVDKALGWSGRAPDLRSWLTERKWLDADSPKPRRPKEAMEDVLWTLRKPRSSAIYREIARKVSVTRCVDPAFSKLRSTLRAWFTPGKGSGA